ncbi:MAG: choice-of-anchor B family protein, partial [Rubricoccaceae bacterium]|nr:choice-of-anchor B family protein [Rubricoccaceae bacterium]
MRRLLRIAPLALGVLYVLGSSSGYAQPIPCTDGMAGEYACTDLDLYARIPVDEFGATAGNDIWGWTDPETGKEYALMGLRESTGFVDITEPANPQILGIMMTATDPSVWRDIKVYQDHAFIVSEAPNHGMQVFDLTRLRGLSADPEREFEPETVFIGTDDMPLGSAHNIVMNEDSGFAYAVGAQECAGGLYMINVQDPTNPTYAGCFDEDGYTHDAQCVTYYGPDADYAGREICVNSNEDTITIVDVTDKENPVMLAKGEYPTPGYTHQGWFTEDQRYFIADDELDEIQGFVANTRSMIFDLQDLDSPELIGMYVSENTSADHNMYAVGNRMYQ